MSRGGETAAGAPDCWALSEVTVERWIAVAKPGDQIIYAKGPRLLRSAGVEKISRLSDHGEIRLNFNRSGDGRGQYLATRLDPPPVRPSARISPAPRSGPERDEAQRVMAVLRRHANLNRPCPTNSEIAVQAGLKSPQQAAYQISKLISANQVRVETTVDGQRVVTIVGTGRRTARSFCGAAGEGQS